MTAAVFAIVTGAELVGAVALLAIAGLVGLVAVVARR